MGKSHSKISSCEKYDTSVFCQMRRLYGNKSMQDIDKLIKHHDFHRERTLSVTRLKVVRESVEEGNDKQRGCCVRHVCVSCRRTIDCWVEEGEKRERRSRQKELPCRREEKNIKSEKVEASAPCAPINTPDVSVCSHASPPPYHHYPVAELQALKVDPDLDCSPPRRPHPLPPSQDEASGASPGQGASGEGQSTPGGSKYKSSLRHTPVVTRSPGQKQDQDQQQRNEEEADSTVMGEPELRDPTIEVSEPEGPTIVYRPWTMNDMKEAMAHLPSPDDSGDKFSTELIIFCQEFSPTVSELCRLLAVKLGAANWHKVSGRLPQEDRRRAHRDWENGSNVPYRQAITDLATAMKNSFPPRVDTAKIDYCCQKREESVQDYYVRLHETFNKHSGLNEPPERGPRPDTWECSLRSCFLNGLRPEIAQAVKTSYIEWKNGRIATVLTHALHAEEQQTSKKERAKDKLEKELQQAMVQAGGGERDGAEDDFIEKVEISTEKDVGFAETKLTQAENALDADGASKMDTGLLNVQITKKPTEKKRESRRQGFWANSQLPENREVKTTTHTHTLITLLPAMKTQLSAFPLLSLCKQHRGRLLRVNNIAPGDFVVIRDLRRKSWRAKRWLGTFQVQL